MRFHDIENDGLDLPAPSLSQSWLYAQALAAMGRNIREMRLGSAGIARLLVRQAGPLGAVALIPGGVQWDRRSTAQEREHAAAELPRQLRRQGISILLSNTASPDDEALLRRKGHLPIITGGYSAEWSLSDPVESRRARARGKWRNRLKKAETSGLCIDHARFSLPRDGWLLAAEARQRQARRYSALPLAFTKAVAEIASDQTRLFTATRDGELMGAMLFLMHDGAASYHIGHLGDKGRALSAHTLLLWRASVWLADQGIARLDLGPVETGRSSGLARFKLGSGALPVQRGASCLFSRATAPFGRLSEEIKNRAARVVAAQTDLSCR